ncbi:undifferentiated embryonic cell transcription factor 1 [Suncus etruscus]|uniref:undifferentiated embryonic cell transcription factor 1 n=1 Tax=Suncus etruscus TaxID=109475 RepID=UPI00210F7217|nr:undifferentiated embryonic cell transcription factor 1 [Suncus etruscus]
MLLRPRRPPPPAPPPFPASPDPDPDRELDGAAREASASPARPASPAPAPSPSAPASPGVPPVSPGSAQRTPWSARETELLLGELLQPAVWRALLLDRRRALPTYRRVSAALARQQVRRTPAQCRRRYKFLRDKLRDARGQPPGPFDRQVHELMALLGDGGHPRGRRRSRGRRASSGAPPEPGRPAAPTRADPSALRLSSPGAADSDPSRTLSVPSSPLKAAADAPEPPGTPPALPGLDDHAPCRGPDGSPPPPREDPGDAEHHAPLTLNAALLQTLGHLGDIVTILGPLRDQLLTLNQHVEQLRGSFDQTVSLAVGFILGSAAAERGVLAEPRQ